MREAISITLLLILCTSNAENDINDWRPVFGPVPSHHLYDDNSDVLEHGTTTVIRHDVPQAQALHGLPEPLEPRASVSLGGFQHFVAPPQKPDRCAADKFAFDQGSYLSYRAKVPNMKEFTLCLWSRFYNHSTDHPLFSYSVSDEPRELSLWVNNARGASYFSMAVAGHTMYRLNYPLALDKWHHMCTSWNGRTGEWQLWMGNERVGRGFNNRLVGHVIQGGGAAITGQEQGGIALNQPIGHPVGDSSFTGYPQPPGSLMGEVTMLQLYRVALSAGKAHRDHKHHHVHKFNHNGATNAPPTTPPTEPPAIRKSRQVTNPTSSSSSPHQQQQQQFINTQSSSTPPLQQILPGNTIYTSGQLMRPLMLNLVGGQNQPQPQPLPQQQSIPIQLAGGHSIQQQYINGQFGTRLVSEQLSGANSQQIPQPQALQQLLDPASFYIQQPGQPQQQTNAQQFPLPRNQPPPEQVFQQFLLPNPHLQQPTIFPAVPQPQQPQPQRTQPQRVLQPHQVQFSGGFSGQVAQPVLQYPQQQQQQQQQSVIQGGLVHRTLTNPANVQILEGPPVARRFLFKRDEALASGNEGTVKRSKRTTTKKELTEIDFEEEEEALAKDADRLKRALVQLSDGSIVDDGSIATDQNGVGLAQYGLTFVPAGQQQGQQSGQQEASEDEIKEHDREPAEAEVREVLNLCSACGEEPFEKALVLGWTRVRKMAHGALRAPARAICGYF